MKEVSVDNIAPSLMAQIQKLGAEAVAKAGKIVEDTSNEMCSQAVSKTPIGDRGEKHHLKDAIVVTPSKYNEADSQKFYVSATKWHKYSLVHLIELGHLLRQGGYVQPKPFMKPALDMYKPILTERIGKMLDDMSNKGE